MKTEELLRLGLSREQAGEVLAMNGRDIEHAREGNRRERTELERVRKELEQAGERLATYQKMDLEGLQREALEWKEKARQAEEKARAEASERQLREETQRLYRENGVRSETVIDALVDWERVSLKEGRADGLLEQLYELKDEYGYLFQEEAAPRFSAALGGDAAAETGNAVRAAMGID